MTEAKSTRKDAVSRAISTLVEGICEESDCDLRFSGIEWADAVPVDSLRTFRDELKAVQAQMNQQIDKIIDRLNHRWSVVARSLNRLPLDVLVMIFKEFEPSAPDTGPNTSLFDLLRVCRTWYDAITGSPELWGYLDGSMPRKIARLVIDRSQLHPILVSWNSRRTPEGPGADSLVTFLNLATKNSTRVKTADIAVELCNREKLPELLEAPTPALETLQVRILQDVSHQDQNYSSEDFTLSDGPHLKHLSLHNFTTPLDHPRLSDLITLALSGSSVPQSPEQLLQVLSRLQRLEELDIQNLRKSTGEVKASVPILLPYLKKLVLLCLPNVYNTTILASIYTPLCSHIRVHDWGYHEEGAEGISALDAVIWRPGNDQAATLVGRSNSGSEQSALRVRKFSGYISLHTPMSSHGNRELAFDRRDVPRFISQLATTISQLPSPPAVELEDPNTLEGHISLDPLPWSEVLKSVEVEGRDACRSVLQRLSQRHVIPGTGEVDWVCRKLSKIVLQYKSWEEEDATTDGRALLALVRQRWSGEDGFAGTARPDSFEVYCKKANFPNLFSLKNDITRILPTFKLIVN